MILGLLKKKHKISGKYIAGLDFERYEEISFSKEIERQESISALEKAAQDSGFLCVKTGVQETKKFEHVDAWRYLGTLVGIEDNGRVKLDLIIPPHWDADNALNLDDGPISTIKVLKSESYSRTSEVERSQYLEKALSYLN